MLINNIVQKGKYQIEHHLASSVMIAMQWRGCLRRGYVIYQNLCTHMFCMMHLLKFVVCFLFILYSAPTNYSHFSSHFYSCSWPIIPLFMLINLFTAVGNKLERTELMRDLLNTLPQPNFIVLKYILDFLHKVSFIYKSKKGPFNT
jgi:hypothetical protein